MSIAAFVAIPVRNEAEEIVACLRALAGQRHARLNGAVLCLNNCTDATGALVRHAAPSLPFAVHVLEVELPPDLACAGMARRMAMERAVELAGDDGAVLTTDADGRAAPGWLAANLAALRRGAEAVAGQADIDPAGAALIPQHLHDIDARECAYATLLDEIRALVDPDPADPWPRHDEHSGASIAVTTAAYRRAGGMPAAPLGEDREFFAALRQVDARIRHEPAARVVVSARIMGRAPGGMADTIRRRMAHIDALIDDRLEPAADGFRRARLRARLNAAWCQEAGRKEAGRKEAGRKEAGRMEAWRKEGGPRRVAARLGLSLDDFDQALRARYFGQAWAEIERASPALRRHRVALADLARESARAARLRDWLRGWDRVSAAEDRAGIPLRTAAE